MKTHVITVLLAVLTTLLTVQLMAQWFRPAAVEAQSVEAQSGFSSVQFTRSDGAWWFFDTRTGDLWIYDEARKLPLWHYRMRELGGPLEKVSLTGKTPEQILQEQSAAGQAGNR